MVQVMVRVSGTYTHAKPYIGIFSGVDMFYVWVYLCMYVPCYLTWESVGVFEYVQSLLIHEYTLMVVTMVNVNLNKEKENKQTRI